MQTTLTRTDRIKNNLKLHTRMFTSLKDVIMTARNQELNLIEYTPIGYFKDAEVVRSETVMGAMGGIIAFVNNDFCGTPTILVDNFFYTLSVEAKEFVLWHEYGHTQDEDMVPMKPFVRQLKRQRAIKRGELVRDEAFADDYAVGRLGAVRSVKALEEVMALSASFHPSGRDTELELRIKRIKEAHNLI